jgi:mono/diheme cytochrome c family protein
MLRKLACVVTPIAATVVGFGLAISTASADPANGERLARQWCAACHVVAPDQKGTAVDVQPFSAIARMPGFNREKVAFFLLDPHPKMPNMSLSRSEAADLADYIASLATTR